MDGTTRDDEKVLAIGFGESSVAFGDICRDGESGTVELVNQESIASGEFFGDNANLIGEVD